MDRALVPLRPLAWLLAAALVASLAALPVGPVQARALAETDTWLDFADDEPALGDTISITALVELADDPDAGPVTGQVRFDAGATEVAAYDDPTTLGQVALVNGEATLEYTLDEDTLPPGTDDVFFVVAQYLGTDAFAASESEAVMLVLTPTDPSDPVATSVEVTGPTDATAGEETTLTAAVHPAEAAGTVTFTVEGVEAGTATVDAGTAALPYTFEDGLDYGVVASFEPDDADSYLASTSAEFRVVVAGPSYPPPFVYRPTFSFGSGCRPAVVATDPERRVTNPIVFFTNFILPEFSPLVSFIKPFIAFFQNLEFTFSACILQIGPYGGVFGRRAETVPVDCVPTETGYQCRSELPGPIAGMTADAVVPVPAEFAGQVTPVQITVTQVDTETGETSVLYDETSDVDVPRRTTLLTNLVPAKDGVTSVRRGKTVAYRMSVQNAGIVTASKVRACVALSKGATVKSAKGATIKGRQACWTLPSLRSTKSANRTLTVVAPKKAGTLRLTARVTPKRSQADPVTLTRMLPVR